MIATERYVARRLVAGLGVVVGIAGALVFGTQYGRHWEPSALGAIQAVVALCNYLVAHHRSGRAKQGRQPEPYHKPLRVFGGVAGALGLLAFLTGLGIAIQQHEKLTGSSHYIMAVWGFLLTKWGIITWSFCDHLDGIDATTSYTPLINAPV
eukprot:m.37287 g.37287  ORF g.37287 m.37287 type:complete len:152 (-) comp11368_c0_seq4:167-622(-)